MVELAQLQFITNICTTLMIINCLTFLPHSLSTLPKPPCSCEWIMRLALKHTVPTRKTPCGRYSLALAGVCSNPEVRRKQEATGLVKKQVLGLSLCLSPEKKKTLPARTGFPRDTCRDIVA